MKENKVEKNSVDSHINSSQRILLKEIENEKLENLPNNNLNSETIEKNYFSREFESTIMKRKFSSVGFSHVNNNFDHYKNRRFKSNNNE
jgi:hypothetical protein